jgi:4-diphosphocytidyl-2-C-methyl-D-erythritol kinase
MNSTKIKAHAKINIGLEVLNKRTDGFHNINSILTKICLYDEIIISDNTEISVSCFPDINIPVEKNIAYKAALTIKNFYCINNKGAKIEIIKNIPLGAGLGGGSSDAAAIIKGLIQHWNIETGFGDFDSLSILLGSDVPYFLNEGTALATGRGDELKYFKFSLPYWLLIIYPNIEISTQWAYQSLNRNINSIYPTSDLKYYLLKSLDEPEILKKYFRNDFETIVFNKYPQLKLIKDSLYNQNAIFASLSGSGSSVYGFFDSKMQCVDAALRFSDYKNFFCPPEL